MKAVIKSQILRASLLLVAVCLIGFPAQAQYGGGKGEPNNPYLIYTAEQLNTIGLHEKDWDKHFKLMADIDLSDYKGTDFNIIGYWVGLDSPENRPFRGVFDGNDHTISNFTYTCTGKDHIGLFGYIEDPDAEIKNLGFTDPNVDAGIEGWGVGSLAGYLIEGTITECYVEGGSVSGNEEVGGLLGDNWDGIITNCYANVTVSGNIDVGGLSGDNAGTITNCYSLGSVSGDEWVGGLVGLNWGTITNCYSTGHVEGTVDVGGLVGYGGGAIASFWDIETSGQPASAGGIGKTTAEMQTASTFVGWSFGDIWTINEGKDYPKLWWEGEQGEEPEVQQLSDFLTGAGTENEPYLIYTAEELNMIGLFPNDWDKHFKLMVDIDLEEITGTDFNIMGRGPDSAFSGVFDGNGRKISNFTYTSTEALNVGLFGYLKSTAVIKDLGLIDPNVYTGIYEMGGWGVGSLVGLVGDGTIISCYVEGGSVTGGWMVGLLIGYVEEGTVTDCYVEGGSVSGDEDIGGLVGFNQGTITNCYAIGTISCNNGGGLVGTHWAGEITNCYSAGSVTGNEWVGGLTGFNLGTITNCYSAGSVTANDIVGGLVGENYGEIIGSFWDTQTSGQLTSDGGTGKTTVQMQTMRTFTNAGWDFIDIWRILEGFDYPRLRWEKYGGGTGEPNNPNLIYTAEQMNTIGLHEEDWDKHFKLMADIDLAGYSYNQALIAPDVNTDEYYFQGNPYVGIFDGNGHTISNLTITGVSYLGLFGELGFGSTVKDLGVVDVNISGSGDVVGGLLGHSRWGATVIRCYSTGMVNGDDNIGGLVGSNGGHMRQCYSDSTVSGNYIVGGLMGANEGGADVTNCYSTGIVNGDDAVGGLVGFNLGEVTHCYSAGSITGSQRLGGLVGWIYGSIVSSFWDIETSGQANMCGSQEEGASDCDDSFGLTTDEMQTAGTFLDAGWDFVDETENGTEDIWWILEGQDYPRLWWEPIIEKQ